MHVSTTSFFVARLICTTRKFVLAGYSAHFRLVNALPGIVRTFLRSGRGELAEFNLETLRPQRGLLQRKPVFKLVQLLRRNR